MLTRAQKFLVSRAGELDKQTQLDIRSKKIRFADSDNYIRKAITNASGIVVLIDETHVKRAGVSNFDKNKLSSRINLCLEKMMVAYGTTTIASEITDPALVNYTSVRGDIPTPLKNAEISIKQDDKVLLKLPLARFFSGAVSTKVQGDEDAYKLDALQIIKENTPFTVELEFASGSNMGTAANHFIEIRMIGTQTNPR